MVVLPMTGIKQPNVAAPKLINDQRRDHGGSISLYDKMTIPIDVAELVGLVCECLLYGAFFTLFAITTYILIESRRRESLNVPMIVNSLLLFGLATAQIGIDIDDIFVAFIDKTKQERIEFMRDSQPLFAAKHAIFICQTVVGDLFVSYRCYVVWGRNIRAVLLPIALSLSSAACGFQAIWNDVHTAGGSIQAQTQLITALFSLSLAANAVATSLLAFRIWRADRVMRTQNLHRALRLVAESGILNAAYLFAFTLTLINGNAAVEIAPGIGTPLVGIIFSIITIRAALNTEREAHWGQFDTVTTISHGPASSSRRITPSMAFGVDRNSRTIRFVDDLESGLGMDHDERDAERKSVVHGV